MRTTAKVVTWSNIFGDEDFVVVEHESISKAMIFIRETYPVYGKPVVLDTSKPTKSHLPREMEHFCGFTVSDFIWNYKVPSTGKLAACGIRVGEK